MTTTTTKTTETTRTVDLSGMGARELFAAAERGCCVRCAGDGAIDVSDPGGPTSALMETCQHCRGTGEEPAVECDCCTLTAVTYREDLNLHMCAACALECEAEDARMAAEVAS